MESRIDEKYNKLVEAFSKMQNPSAAIQESFVPITEIAKSIQAPFNTITETTRNLGGITSGLTASASAMQQVAGTLKNNNISRNLIAGLEPLIRTIELTKAGFSSRDIAKLIDAGKLEKIKHGVYRLPEFSENDSEAKLIAQLYPDGVITLTSALFYYGYSDRTPMAWNIAIDRDTSKSRFNIDYPYVQPHYMEKSHLTYGTENAQYEDCSLTIFDRDRLICECIKHENKMDREIFNKAIISYVNDNKKNVTHLLDYAKKRNVYKKVKDRIEVWL